MLNRKDSEELMYLVEDETPYGIASTLFDCPGAAELIKQYELPDIPELKRNLSKEQVDDLEFSMGVYEDALSVQTMADFIEISEDSAMNDDYPNDLRFRSIVDSAIKNCSTYDEALLYILQGMLNFVVFSFFDYESKYRTDPENYPIESRGLRGNPGCDELFRDYAIEAWSKPL